MGSTRTDPGEKGDPGQLPVFSDDLLRAAELCTCAFVAGTLSRAVHLAERLLGINSVCAWAPFLVSDNGLLDENQHSRVPLHAVNAVGVFPLEFGICSPAVIESSRIRSCRIFEWR